MTQACVATTARRDIGAHSAISASGSCSTAWKQCSPACSGASDMCGIAGFFGTEPRGTEVMNAMLESLGPRGPDALGAMRWDNGLAVTEDAAPNALLHTRLAIIDPRPEANQPMSNARGDIWLSYNGQ